MGKGSNTTTTSSSPPPQVMAQYENVQNQANATAKNPYYFYPGQMVAGMSPQQTAAIGATGNIAGAMENPANTFGMAVPFINAGAAATGNAETALAGTQGNLAALYNPANTYGQALPFINTGAQMTASGASPVTAGDINQYMNPFLQQAGQTTMAEMNQQNLMQQQGLLGNAAASGALGGNRVGLAQSALANQQDMAENATLANMNMQGYNTALGAAQTTKGQQLQGGFLMGQTGQEAENAALSGLTAPIGEAEGLASAESGLGSQYANLGVTGENAALSGLNAGLTGANAQFGMGTAEQQQQQNQLSAAEGQWLGSVEYPFQNTNYLAGIQSGMGSLMGGTSSTTAPSPSVGSQILGGLTGAAGLAGAIMGLKTGGRVERATGGFTPQVAKVNTFQPMSPMGGNAATSEIGAIEPIAHGPGAPPPPQAQQVQSPSDGGVGGLTKALTGLGTTLKKEAPSTAAAASASAFAPTHMPLFKRGGPIAGFADGGSAGYQVPTPMSEQILDYDMMSQLMPGGQVQKTRYQPPEGDYARGGPIEPEAKADIDAQIRALADPKSARKAVFVPKGTKLPRNLPDGIGRARRTEGTLLSRDRKLLAEFRKSHAMPESRLAEILGYPHSKEQVGPNPAVVRAHDGNGVAYEAATHPAAIQGALALASAHSPTGRLDVTDPETAIRDRRVRRGYAGGGAPTAQGMAGVSSMPLVGAQAGLSKPDAGTLQAANFAGFSAPQAHALSLSAPSGAPTTSTPVTPPVTAPTAGFASLGSPSVGSLNIPTTSTGAQFAPVTMPGGATTGTITDASGIPSNYFDTIYKASPYYNSWSSATAPSSGLTPNSPNPAAAPAGPSQADIQKMIQQDLLQQNEQQQAQQERASAGHARGGRIRKADGGPLAPDPAAIAAGTAQPASAPAPVTASAGAPIPVAGVAPNSLPFTVPLPANAPVPGGVSPASYYGSFANEVGQAESGNNPNATNPRSTASGPDQFTDQTWLSLVRQAAPQYAAGKSEAQLLALRNNPGVSKEMTEFNAVRNANALIKAGDPLSHTNLYLAHHYGAMGAQDILAAPANTPAAKILSPAAIAANPGIADKTTAQLIAQAGGAVGAHATVNALAQNGTTDGPMPGIQPPSRSTGTLASPFVVPTSVTGAVNQAQQPVGQIHVPRTTGLEKMMESPWMALADAGFSMMGGTSPFAAVNIGRGLDAGVHYAQHMLPQQRARQDLQANVRQTNMANLLTQRQQGLQGANAINTANEIGVSGLGALPHYQSAQITANAVPGVSAPPPIPGVPVPSVAPRGAQVASPFSPSAVTKIPTNVPLPAATMVGPTGETESYSQALRQAQALLLSPATSGAAQNWLNSYGPQSYKADLTQLSDQASSAAIQKQQLDELQVATHQFLTGPGANTRAALLKDAQTFANATGLALPSDLVQATTAAQLIPKISTFIQSGLTRLASDRGGAVVMHEVMNATPNITNTRQGLGKLIRLYDTLADRTQAMSNYVQQAVQGGYMTYSQAQNAFNQQYSPELWASRVDPLPAPATTNALQPGYVYRQGDRSAMWTGDGWKNY